MRFNFYNMDKWQYYVLINLSSCWHLTAVISGAVVKDSMILLRKLY